ncbi:hypothetical protein KRX54_06660 [Actinomycetaceae bacterium TAE3-ERU4]|nr:hypothetical protein [Actinomycetaceae bacterium TAE3-ERU4]
MLDIFKSVKGNRLFLLFRTVILMLIGGAIGLRGFTHSLSEISKAVKNYEIAELASWGILSFCSATLLLTCVWQSIWLLLALIAKNLNSNYLKDLVAGHGTKVAKKAIGIALSGALVTPQALALGQENEAVKECSNSTISTFFDLCEGSKKIPTDLLPFSSREKFPQPIISPATHRTFSSNKKSSSTIAKEIKNYSSPPNTYLIKPGDCLWTIAKKLLHEEKKNSPTNLQIHQKTKEIYRINREKIGANPDLIIPGVTLNLTERK